MGTVWTSVWWLIIGALASVFPGGWRWPLAAVPVASISATLPVGWNERELGS
jgi:hypothetical protein